VTDEIWRDQLRTVRSFILARMARDLGDAVVTDIEFRVVPPRMGPARENRVVRQPAQGLPLFDEVDDGIADPNLALIYRNNKRSSA
jgi:hypothetical protein